jgi:hypothetical protein
MDWKVSSWRRGLDLGELEGKELESFKKAYRVPAVQVGKNFAVYQNFHVQPGISGWDRAKREGYLIAHVASKRNLRTSSFLDKETALKVCERLAELSWEQEVDWGLGVRELGKLPAMEWAKYLEVVRCAVRGCGGAGVGVECYLPEVLGAIEGKKDGDRTKLRRSRRVSMAPKRATTELE